MARSSPFLAGILAASHLLCGTTGMQFKIRTDAKAGFDQFGQSTCPCVGLGGFLGTTPVMVDGHRLPSRYDREIGSSCRDWDRGKYPDACHGTDSIEEEWCSQPWCYVDINNCDAQEGPDEEKGPFTSRYLEGAAVRGHNLFYSYVTCGGKNTYTRKYRSDADTDSDTHRYTKHPHTHRSATLASFEYGISGCECVGIEGLSGTTEVVVNGKLFTDLYHTDTGSSCQAWDANKYPTECDGSRPSNADWCSQSWCWVDPDKCNTAKGPYETQYMPHLTYHGKLLHYSYEACGGTNTFNH